MKPITFPAGGMLAGLATMLDCLGYDTDDRTIAFGMEAPYLLMNEQDGYKAGAGLYRPKWLNLYLNPRGFHMTAQKLTPKEVCPYLRTLRTAMLTIKIDKGITHPVVFTGYTDSRYTFTNVKPIRSAEPDHFNLSSAVLKRRLEDEVTVYTVMPCEPVPVDFAPLLLSSLDNLITYQDELLSTRERTMTRDELTALHEPLFRPLMKDLQPLMTLIEDISLSEELRRLNHDYRHVFTSNDGDSIRLSDRLPKTSIRLCISWLRDNILDRLYELGVPDEVIDAKFQAVPRKKRLL